jgi:mono/diheme cytochrome c family protein
VFGVFCLLLTACGRQDRELARGAALYQQNCVICHGADLRGGGGVGVPGLNRVPSDLTVLTLRSGGRFPTAEVLAVLDAYAQGAQQGRLMRPFAHLDDDKRRRVRTSDGRQRVSAAQAALLAYLEAQQLP